MTARRREESLQETPVAVTAFSGAQIDRLNIQQIDRISQLTPNLAITEQTASLSASTIHIRGIGEQNPILTSESGVGLYLDGVYVARTSGAIFDLVDLERIEVLRGPQGTLFGRNTTGGAIQLVSRAPAREFGLQGKLGYGRFGEWYARMQLDTGLLADGPLRASLAYLHRERDGYVDNTLTPDGQDPGSIDTDAIRATLRGDFGKFTANYAFDYNDRRGSPMFFQLIAATPDVRDYFSRSPLFGGSSFLLSTQRAGTVQRTEAAVTPRTESVSRIQGHALTLEQAFTENLMVKSITSYRDMDVDFIFGLSGNGRLRGVVLDPLTFAASIDEVTPIQGFQNDRQNQFSQELQLLGHGARWDYVLGAFYFREHIDTTSNQFLTFVLPGGQAGINLRPQSIFSGKSESVAVFGQISYRPSVLQDRVEVTGGARITRDRKSLNVTAPAPVSGSDDFEQASWLASLDYKVTDSAMIYGRATTGYKSGGLNPAAGFLNSYGPEKALTLELGLKSEWLDRRLRANLALFHTTYDDLQVQQFVAGTGGSQSLFVNAGEARYQGVELEFVARVLDRLTLEGSLGYTDPRYESFEFRDPASNQLLNVAGEAKFPT
ncbi:MAG: TonB-dependent receptor [Gammaproteobacteria bacterium]|nr:TonB-dependent receptor [Gammaproteobacteria bacterium]